MRGFIIGFICGAATLYGALSFHVVRTKDGVSVIPKIGLSLKDVYVDTREFGFSDWKEHPELTTAITKAERTDLMSDSAIDSIHKSIDGLMHGDQ